MPVRARTPIGIGRPVDLGPGATLPGANVVVGPTAYNQSLTAALSFAGAAQNLQTTRLFAAALTLNGAGTIKTMRILVGTFTPSGSMSRVLSLARTLTASLTPSGSLARTLTLFRAIAGALSFSGATIKFAGSRLLASAVFTPSGVVSSSKVLFRTLVGAVFTPSGATPLFALTRALAATFTPAGTLARTLSLSRTLTGALSFSGSAVKFAMLRALTSAAFTPSGSMSRATSRFRTLTAAAFTPVGVVTRSTARRVTAAFTPTAALSASKSLLRTLTAAFTPTGSLGTATAHIVTVTLQAALTFISGSALYPDTTLYPGVSVYPYYDQITWLMNRTLPSAVAGFSGVVAQGSARIRTFTGAILPTGQITKTATRVFSATLGSVAAFNAQKTAVAFTKLLTAGLRATGGFHAGIVITTNPDGGGGYATPMHDDFFRRYTPTLRRQKTRV